MEITNEELEVLNRATEILSRFVYEGGIKKEVFDLFDGMVESAIDADPDTRKSGRMTIETPPYARLIIAYMIGYYDEKGEPCFSTDVSFVNVVFESDHLTFNSCSIDLDKILNTINEFTFSCRLITQKGEKVFMRQETLDDFIEEARTIHAPYLNSSPLVFECKFEGRSFSKYTAKISNIHATCSSIDRNGDVDVIKAWGKAIWKEVN